jgi:hypothetical protein
MPQELADYYETRAEQEIALAEQSSCRAAVRAHYKLSELYLDRIYGSDEPRPTPSEDR